MRLSHWFIIILSLACDRVLLTGHSFAENYVSPSLSLVQSRKVLLHNIILIFVSMILYFCLLFKCDVIKIAVCATSVGTSCLGTYCPGSHYTGSTCIDGYCRCANNAIRDYCTCLCKFLLTVLLYDI